MTKSGDPVDNQSLRVALLSIPSVSCPSLFSAIYAISTDFCLYAIRPDAQIPFLSWLIS